MKRQLFLSLLLVVLGTSAVGYADWVSIGDGIDYQEFTASGPNNLFVSRMAISNTNTTYDTAYAYDTMAGAVEIVPNQAARQDGAITWWGGSWGATYDVVAAVNGGFWIMSYPYDLEGGMCQGGWHSMMYDDMGAFSGFMWKTDRTPLHGECVDYQAAKFYVKFVSNGNTQVIDGINRTPGTSDLIIFTPHYDAQTPSGTRTEVLVQMNSPNLTTSGTGYTYGTIISKATSTGSTYIPFDHVVLSAAGSEGTTLNTNATVGGTVRFYQELVEKNEPDVQGNYACQTATGRNLSNIFAGINSNYHFLENNVVRVPDADAHPGYLGYVILNPRTAVCWNSTYVFFVVCDGRSDESVGMSCETLGYWVKNNLGATDGVNCDGGGSSTMVVNGTITNVPSDGSPRPTANSQLMVNIVPKVQSTRYTTSQTIYAAAATNGLLGPGSNYKTRASISANSQGSIASHSINGVYAKGAYWWYCNFGGTKSWVSQAYLTATLGQQEPNITQHPTNVYVGAGSAGYFTVAANGDGTLYYQWQKDGTNISNGGHYSGATTATLLVSTCDTNDEGYYRCVVSSAYGSDTSNTASLTVGPPTTSFIVESRSGGQNYLNYSESGTWGDNNTYKSSAAGCTPGIGHRWCTIGSTPVSATFTFTPGISGTYEVYTTNCTTDNSGNPLVHKVSHSGGTTNVNVCQNTSCGTNAVNKWYSLGQYNLNASTQYSVILDGSTGAGSYPSGNAGRSDAIKWTLVSGTGPTITQQPSNQTANTGGTANFTVAASGNGTLYYQWQKNQANLSNGGHYSGVTTATLTISSADTNDAAYYRCVVTDNDGSVASNEASLTVLACSEPVLTNGNFEYSTAASPPYGWTTYIQSGMTGSWTLQTATPPEGTLWQQTQVLNINAYGGIRQNVTGLTNGAVYTITGSYKTNSTSCTASVRYSLSANTDRASSTVLVSKTDTNWGTFSGVVTATGSSMTLFLDALMGTSASKTGAFDNIKVVMTDCPTGGPTITQQPSAQNICPAANASFSVAATGEGTLTYQWQKDAANLSNGGHYSGCTTATLAITGADTNDVANYRCVVSDNNGDATSNAAGLTLKSATTITSHPSNQTIAAGGSANFSVGATGDGALAYQWQKNSVNMTNGGHYSGVTTATMTVSTADTNDAANYRCIVTGGCGSATSNAATLTVTTCSTPTLTNGNFEYSTVGNPPYGWTTYVQSTKSGVFSIQTASPPEGTRYQQTQMYNASSYGGVRQNVTGLTSGFVYTISGTYRTNSTSATASVRYNLSANTDRANSTVLVSKTSTDWGTFSANVTATGSSLSLFLDHLNGTSTNKASAFDNIKVQCAP